MIRLLSADMFNLIPMYLYLKKCLSNHNSTKLLAFPPLK